MERGHALIAHIGVEDKYIYIMLSNAIMMRVEMAGRKVRASFPRDIAQARSTCGLSWKIFFSKL